MLAAFLSYAKATADQSVTVAWYGGNWGDAFNACVAKPFTETTGIAVKPEIGTSIVTLSKLKQQKGSASIDVAWMDGGVSELAADADLLDTLDSSQIPNLVNVQPQAIYKSRGSNFAVGTGYYSVGIVYNTEKVKTPLSSWGALWKPDFAAAVTIPSPSNSAGIPLLVFLNSVFSASPNELTPIFDKVKSLQAALFFDSSGAASTAFQTGEVVAGAHYSAAAWDLAAKGLPIRFVVPKEGVWATDARLHLIRGSKNKAAAEKFINTALTKEAAHCLAEKLYLGPAVKDVSIDAALAEKMPWGKGGSVDNLNMSDWSMIKKMRPGIVDRGNRENVKYPCRSPVNW